MKTSKKIELWLPPMMSPDQKICENPQKRPKKQRKWAKNTETAKNGQKWNNFLGPNGPFFEPTFSNFSKHLGKIG